MKKALVFVSLALMFSCSDGDLQIETIDFDTVDPQNCDDLTESTQVFFKINSDEALILTLQSGLLNDGVVGDTITQESEVPNESELLYRIFSDNVTTNYFCDDIPATEPTVVEEIPATDGMVIIETIANADSTEFDHTIQLSGISLVNDQGERITDLTISDFGVVSTEISN